MKKAVRQLIATHIELTLIIKKLLRESSSVSLADHEDS